MQKKHVYKISPILLRSIIYCTLLFVIIFVLSIAKYFSVPNKTHVFLNTTQKRLISKHTYNTEVGQEGKLLIPSHGIEVKLYNVEKECENSEDLLAERQQIVDNSDSAIIYPTRNNNYVILDHASQTFLSLPQVQIGDVAFLYDSQKNKTVLFCIGTEIGQVTNTSFQDLNFKLISDQRSNEYIMSTCLGVDGKYRFNSYWKEKTSTQYEDEWEKLESTTFLPNTFGSEASHE